MSLKVESNYNEKLKINNIDEEKIEFQFKDSNETNNFIEPILDPRNERFAVRPIDPKYERFWKLYKKMQGAFWKLEEIDFSNDYTDYKTLDKDARHSIKRILAFFAIGDGLVSLNISGNFLREVKIIEIYQSYVWIIMMENIHNETYSAQIDNIIKNKKKKDELINGMKEIESIKRMTDWIKKWADIDKSFAQRVVANCIVEGLFFSSAFAVIFWLKKFKSKGKHFLNGLFASNNLISIDEGMHVVKGFMVYDELVNKLDITVIYEMFDEAVEIAKFFADDCVHCKQIGINIELMQQYQEFIADQLIFNLGYEKKYGAKNCFDFMDELALDNKINFFEKRNTTYTSASNSNYEEKLVLLDDF